MCISVLGEASVTAEPPSSKTWGAAQAIMGGRSITTKIVVCVKRPGHVDLVLPMGTIDTIRWNRRRVP
jgi:hypothetical protein